MSPWRLLPPLFFLALAQVALHRGLTLVFSLKRNTQLWLAAAQGVVALSFFGLLALARTGDPYPALLRPFVIEPLLAAEALSIPFLLALGIGISLAQRLPPKPPDPEQLPEPRRVFLRRGVSGLIAITGAAIAAGIEQAELAPQVSHVDVPIPDLPADLEGLTIAQLSDIHAGALMTEARMSAIAKAVSALNADVVVLTGDLLDVSARAGGPFARAFTGLQGKLGSYAILGNHDAWAGVRAASTAVQDAGVHLFRNSGMRIGRGKASLWIAGVDDEAMGTSVDAARALKGADPREPRILLAHRPSLFHECADAGAHLVLSGHTHGGQIALSRSWSLARTLGPYTMGLFQRGASHLYVHRGMGTVGPVPVRLGSPPEIALLTLRRS